MNGAHVHNRDENEAGDVAALRASFEGSILTPANAEYTASLARWAANTARPAALVAQAASARDVALALAYARERGLRVAVHGGGHGRASSVDGGLVISLQHHFKWVTVDAARKVARCGGGSTWADVDAAAIAHGLASVAGTVNHTGVVGLALGGGFGWLSGRHALVVDNIVEATIVTASGDVLKASKQENSDLFWALRGGGGNFGVVTELVLQLHPQRRTVYAGHLAYVRSPEMREKLGRAMVGWLKGAGEDDGASFVFAQAPNGGPPLWVVVAFFNGSAEEGAQKFKAFLELEPVMNTLQERPYEELNALHAATTAYGQNYWYKGAVYDAAIFAPVSPSPSPSPSESASAVDFLAQMDAAHATLAGAAREKGISLAVIMDVLPLDRILNAAGKDECSFNCRGPQRNLVVNASWAPSAHSADTEAFAGEVVNKLWALWDAHAETSADTNSGYGNYADDATTATEQATRMMFGRNYAKLQKVKAKYDPDNVFRQWFPIQPKA